MKLFASIYRFLLSLRYKVEVKNIEVLEKNKNNPLLIFPNHIALVDPQILLTHLYKKISAVPVVSETFYSIPIANCFFKKIGAVPVSNIQRGNGDLNVLKKVTKQIKKELEDGKKILLYPAGQISGQGFESIIGKQTAFEVAKILPQHGRIIGVRIRGLWGSMWSRAWIGDSPPFFLTLLRAIGIIFANLIFFVPKRKIFLEFEDITDESKKFLKKDHHYFNQYLEKFYNIHGVEKPLFLKHFFYTKKSKRKLPKIIKGSLLEAKNTTKFEVKEIDKKVLSFVQKKIATMKEISSNEILLEKNLILDLYFDSLNLAEIVAILKNEYSNSSDPPLTSLKTVADLCFMAMGKSSKELVLPNCSFKQKTVGKKLEIEEDKTVLSNFLKTFSKQKNTAFCYDALQGTISRKEFFLKSVIVSNFLKKRIKGKHCGIMLPALQTTNLCIAGTYLAGKIPVMLNWTVGEKALAHCMKTVKIKKILTAKTFFETVKDKIPETFHKNFIFLDEELSQLTLWDKIWGITATKLPKRWLFKNPKNSDSAVILFTSGSESLPKAVSLTHQNLLSDIVGTLKIVPIKDNEIVCGFLPPFHSFGFTITSILPLLTGLKVAYSPNPSDGNAIRKIIKQAQTSLILGTPTFLKIIMNGAIEKDFKSVKLAITGAEAAPKSLFKMFKKLTQNKGKILEGYGITECAPIVTTNPILKQKLGSVGKFIEGIEYKILNIETNKSCELGEAGMIYVSGKNVFGGYLDKKIESPFQEIEGKTFYKTGDLGFVDSEGFLFITGRLKRFIKIGGEMISLPFIENLLLEKYGKEDELVLAIEGSDKNNLSQIILFTTQEMYKKEVNKYLVSKGASLLMQVTDIRLIDEIPVLGTGKVDYKVLKKELL